MEAPPLPHPTSTPHPFPFYPPHPPTPLECLLYDFSGGVFNAEADNHNLLFVVCNISSLQGFIEQQASAR